MSNIKRIVVISVLSVEFLRLIGWSLFLMYLSGMNVSQGRENEVMILVYTGSFYLGFPYSWLGALVYEGLSILPARPFFLAFFQGLFWFFGVMVMIYWLHNKGRKAQS
jgi:hypothetical protein